MELVFLSRQNSGTIKLSGKILCLVAIITVPLLCAFSFYAGSYYSLEFSSDTIAKKYQQLKSVQTQQFLAQQQEIDHIKQDAQSNLDALAARLSKLQGHMMRLDALGSRLADMANLEDIDFNYNEPLGMGGPEPDSFETSMNVSDFLHDLQQLSLEIDDRNDKLTAIEAMLLGHDLQSRTLPEGMPISSGYISSLFGWRTDPFTGKREFHEGIDLAGQPRSKVKAVAAGVVTWSDYRSGYGKLVEIDHGNGYVTRYAHCKENLVKVGDTVEKGQPIAIIGSTGRSTGTHVHFEVIHNGTHVDPKKYLSLK